MRDPDWYADWRHDAVHLLQEQNARIKEQFEIDRWPRYDYDLATRRLWFSDGGAAKVIADIQVIGSTSENAGNWLWAWANSHWPEDCVEDAERACSFGEKHGIGELTSGYVENSNLNGLGWELAAVTARICGAAGAYRPPRDEGGYSCAIATCAGSADQRCNSIDPLPTRQGRATANVECRERPPRQNTANWWSRAPKRGTL